MTAQCAGSNCGVCAVSATITSIGGGNIIVGTSQIPGTTQGGGNSTAPDPLIITANSCGVIEFSVELDFDWDRGDQANWIHGISFSASDGWEAAVGVPPSNAWIFLDTITGCCSGNGYGAGYYYDPPTTEGSSNCCGNGDTQNKPEDNYGINCTTNCPTFGFNLRFCPDTVGTATEVISFFLTEDGETGGWDDSDGCIFLLSFPIIMESAGAQLPDSIGPICEGDCTILDAGTGCTSYLWSTGESGSTIEVCPTENSSYGVTATGEGGCVITGQVKVLVESCCSAEAGELTADPQPTCPGTTVTVEANNFQDSLPFEQYILIVDDDGLVTNVILGPIANVSLDSCGTITVYSYNFESAGDSPIPVIGLDISTIDCEVNCCDLEMILVSFEDTEAPTFLDLPEDVTLACFDLLLPIQDLEYEDNCEPNGFVSGVEDGTADLCDGGNIARTWEYQDACGNLGTHIQTITIDSPPEGMFVDPPGDESVMCSAIPSSASNLQVTNDALGACLFESTVSPVMSGSADACGGEVVFTWEFTDPCGNEISHVQTYTVEPAPEPAFLNPPDNLTVSCDNIPTDATDLLYTNNETDDCLIEGIVSATTVSDLNTCGGEITNTWTFTDACDRSIEHMQTIIVEPPPAADFINVPADITVSCENAPTGNGPDLLYTNDQVGACAITGIIPAVMSGEFNLCGGTIVYTWSFTDDCDRSIEAQQTITIEPAPAPVLSNMPADITVSCENLPTNPPSLTYTNNGLGQCMLEGIIEPIIDGTVDGCGGQIAYTWTFENDCHNITHTQTVTVEPAPPAAFISAPSDLTVDCENIPPAPQLAYSNNLTGQCAITGNVGPTTSGSINGCGGVIMYTWVFTDNCGRTIDHVQNVIVDPAAPAEFINPPVDITINCDEVELDPPFLNYSNNANGDCLIEGQVQALQTGVYNACGGTISYTWNFSDDCGRGINHTQNITINPAPPPVFLDLPEDIMIDCGSPFPNPVDLEYSNGGSEDCEIAGIAIASTEVNGNISVYTWTFSNPCTFEEIIHQQTLIISQEPDIIADQSAFEFCEGLLFDLTSIEITDVNNTNPTITFHDDTPADLSNELSSNEINLLIDRTIYILASNDFGCADEIEINFTVEVPPFVGEDEFHFICFEDLLPVSLFEYIDPFADLDGTWIDVDGSGVDISDPFFVDFSNNAGNTFNFDYLVESSGICPNDTMRLELTLVPEILAQIESISCMDDPSLYEVLVIPNGNAVEATRGDVIDQGNGMFLVANIPISDPVTISVGDQGTLCFKDFEISPPNCDCPSVLPPINNGDQTICQGGVITPLTVSVDPNHTANWYQVSTGGISIQSASLTFTPDINLPGTYTYYVESESLDNPGCVSLIRTPVVLIINANPLVEDAFLELCDDDRNGFEEFTLNEAESQISIDPSFSYSYHLALEDANNGTNPISLIYQNISNPQLIYVRVSNPQGCATVAELSLQINEVIEIDIYLEPELCDGQNNGLIRVLTNEDRTGWEYSLDNAIWQTDSVFNNLVPRDYILYIRNESCAFESSFSLGAGLLMTLDSFSIECNDNSSQTDPNDDFYVLTFIVNANRNAITNYSIKDGSTDLGDFNYGVLQTLNISANGQNLSLTFEDQMTGCFFNQDIGPLNPCSTNCEVAISVLEVMCNGAGTPTNPNDDFYNVTIDGTTLNGDATFNVLIDGLLSYNYEYGTGGSFTLPADGSSPILSIVDSQDDQCFVSQSIGPLNPCSDQCIVNAEALNIICNDQNSPEDAADDTYSFELNVSGLNGSSTWQIQDLAITGNFGEAMSFGPRLISDGDLNLRIEDFENPDCYFDLLIEAPAPCSEACRIELINFTELICNNNGTNNNNEDDFFKLDFRIDKLEGAASPFNVIITGPNMFELISTDLTYGIQNTIDSLPALGEALTVVITDENNPNCQTTFIIEQASCSECSQVIEAGIGGTITCTQREIRLTGGGPTGGDYLWTGPNNFNVPGLTASAEFPGVYFLNALFDDQCEAIDSVQVLLSEDVPVVDAGPDLALTCEINDLILGSSLSSIGPDIIYIWRDENGNIISDQNTLNVDAVGIYSLELIDTLSQCSSGIDLVNVIEDADEPSAIIYLNPGNQLNCVVDKITLSTDNEPDVVYTWTFGGETMVSNSIDVGNGGEVVLVALDTITGCENSNLEFIDDLEIYPIIRIQNVPALTCVNNLARIDASGSQVGENIIYQWYSSRNNPIAGAVSGLLEIDMSGVYYLELIDTTNGCTNIDSVVVLEDFENPIISAGDDIFLECEETETLLTATIEGNVNDFEITWTSTNGNIVNGINTLNPLVDELGRYYIQIFDPLSGCTSVDSVLVEGNPDGPQLAYLQIDSISCENDNNGMLSITNVEGGSPPFTYTLNGNMVNQEGLFTNLGPGIYRINITDDNGCRLDTSIQLEEGVSLDINLQPTIILGRGDSATIEAMVNYPIDRIISVQWSPIDGLSCPTCLVTRLLALNPSQYTVTIINDLGCVAFANFRLIIEREVNVFVPNVFSPNGDNVNDLITVFTDETVVRVNKMMIFDRWGEKVYHNQDFAPNDIQAGWDGTLNGELLNPAVFVYVVEVEFDNGDIGSFSGDITLIR